MRNTIGPPSMSKMEGEWWKDRLKLIWLRRFDGSDDEIAGVGLVVVESCVKGSSEVVSIGGYL
jgi:hypothetical protein